MNDGNMEDNQDYLSLESTIMKLMDNCLLLTTETLALVRGEVQIACFQYLQSLTITPTTGLNDNDSSLNPKPSDGGSMGLGLGFSSRFNRQSRRNSMNMKPNIDSSNLNMNMNSNSNSKMTRNMNYTSSMEGIMSLWSQVMMEYYSSLSAVLATEMVTVIFSPTITIAPRLFQICLSIKLFNMQEQMGLDIK